MPFREVGMSLHAIQERDSKVVGINVEIVISVRGAFQEIANKFMNFGIFGCRETLGVSKFQKGD